jgi:hypothetical protein
MKTNIKILKLNFTKKELLPEYCEKQVIYRRRIAIGKKVKTKNRELY